MQSYGGVIKYLLTTFELRERKKMTAQNDGWLLEARQMLSG